MNNKTRKMKNIIILCIVLAIYLTTGVAGAQLNTNGSFESSAVDTVAGTEVEGWVIELAASADAIFEIVDDTVRQGTKALKITVNTIASNSWDIQVIGDSIPVQQGETYQFSVWAKSSGSSRVNFTVGNYSYTEYANIIRPTGPNVTTEWQEYTFTFTVNDAVEYIRAPIHFSLSENTGDRIYIDNLRIINTADVLKPVTVEAESGDVGSDFNILPDDTITYVSIDTTSTAFNPVSIARIISYEVTFPDTGTYDLFVRLRVGPGTYNDDSFFYGNGFGEKNITTDVEWAFINGVAAAGFSDPDEVVYEAGGLGSNVWKWVNVSRNAYQGSRITNFKVVEDSLTQTFQIGGRENGLDIDKLAFGKSYLYYTVGNLDNGEPGSSVLPGEVWEGPPLATNLPKFVGNVYSSSQAQNFKAYWNQVSPENAGKWGSVEGTRNAMNWYELDAAYYLAKDNGFPFHFHVLIWGSQQPAWIDTLSPEDKLVEITQWFEAVAERYDDIDYLEVVNEPLPGHNPPDGIGSHADYKDALGGDGETGWDWVVTAFQMARDIFPAKTKLMINDFNIISSTSSTAQYIGLIRLLQAENLIDIIGVQGHAFTTTAATDIMIENLDSLATTGLPIQVTELDIDGTVDNIQLQSYQRIFPALYEHPGVMGITLWGWRRGLWRDAQGAYLVNQNGTERPSLEWLRDYLTDLASSVEDIVEAPFEYRLDNNYPNPFNPLTQIPYSIKQRGHISLKVYNILGQEVTTLFEGVQQPGKYQATFDGKGLASGVYLYQLKAENYVKTKKLILLK